MRVKGKSFNMLVTASKEGAVVFCSNVVSENRILQQAKEIGVTVKTIVKK